MMKIFIATLIIIVSISANAQSRVFLTENQSYYVNCSTGSNTNSGEASSPFADPVHAYQVAQQTLDLGGQYTVTVNLASNCTDVQWTFVGPLVGAIGARSFVVEGAGEWTTIVTGASGGYAFQVQSGAAINVTDFACEPSTTGGCLLANNGTITGSNIGFVTSSSEATGVTASFMDAAGPTSLIIMGQFGIASTTYPVNIAVVSEDHAQIALNGQLSMYGGPTWNTAFAQADLGGMIDGTGFTYSGGIPTGPRYSAISNGIVFSGIGGCSALFWPGSVAGSVSSGGFCG